MNIQILGTGCPKCKSLEKLTREVVEQNGLSAEISKVEDIMEIMKFNVMSTPALVVNGKVEIKGRIPSAGEIKAILSKYEQIDEQKTQHEKICYFQCDAFHSPGKHVMRRSNQKNAKSNQRSFLKSGSVLFPLYPSVHHLQRWRRSDQEITC